MAFTGYPEDGLQFLAELKDNNNREWFEENRIRYETGLLEPGRALVETLGLRLKALRPGMQAIPKVNKSLFRLNRDTRFSKDKTPYKTNVAITLWEGGKKRMASPGMYVHFSPDEFFLGGGMYMFSKTQLPKYRDDVADDARGPALVEALKAVEAKGLEVGGDCYKKVPRGFDADHPRGELLKRKGLYMFESYDAPPPQLHSAELVDIAVSIFERMLPLHEWLLPLAE